MILFWEILQSVNIIFTENKWKKAFSKTEAFSYGKTVAHEEKSRSFSNSMP